MTDVAAPPSVDFDLFKKQLRPGTEWTDDGQKKAFVEFLTTAGASPSAIMHEMQAVKESELNPNNDRRDIDPGGVFKQAFRECLEEAALRCLRNWVRNPGPAASAPDFAFQRARFIITVFKLDKVFIGYCIRYLTVNTDPTYIMQAHANALVLAQLRDNQSTKLLQEEQDAFVAVMIQSPNAADLGPAYKQYRISRRL